MFIHKERKYVKKNQTHVIYSFNENYVLGGFNVSKSIKLLQNI